MLLALTGCKTDRGGVAGNTPPSIKAVKIYPVQPTSQTRAQVMVEMSDPENDNVTYTAKWLVNGKEVAEGGEFNCAGIKRGDRILATVTPFDGKEYGKTVRSAVVTAGNIAPKVTEAKLDPETIFATTRQAKVMVRGTDQDGDSLRFVCRWFVGGENRPDSGATIDNLRLKKGDRFTIDVLAHDGESYSLGHVINGTVANSPPELSAKTDSVMAPASNFSHSLAITDPDGDKLTYAMTSGPTTVQVDPNTGVISGTIERTAPVEIRATDTEGAYLDVRFTLRPANRQ